MTAQIRLRSYYHYPSRVKVKHLLSNFRVTLSDSGTLISVRSYHRILEETLISSDYKVFLDGAEQSESTFIAPYSRRAFSNLLSAPIGPGLLRFEIESWQFCDGALQCLAELVQLSDSIPNLVPNQVPEERQQAS